MALTHQLTKSEKQALFSTAPQDLDEQATIDVTGVALAYFAKATKAESKPYSERTAHTYLKEFSEYANYSSAVLQAAIDELNAASEAHDPIERHSDAMNRANSIQGGFNLYNMLTSLKHTVNRNIAFIEALGYQLVDVHRSFSQQQGTNKTDATKIATVGIRMLNLIRDNETIANLVVYIAAVTGITSLTGVAKEWYQGHIPYVSVLNEAKIDDNYYDITRHQATHWNGAIKVANSEEHIFTLMTMAHAKKLEPFTLDQLNNNPGNEQYALVSLLNILGTENVTWEDLI